MLIVMSVNYAVFQVSNKGIFQNIHISVSNVKIIFTMFHKIPFEKLLKLKKILLAYIVQALINESSGNITLVLKGAQYDLTFRYNVYPYLMLMFHLNVCMIFYITTETKAFQSQMNFIINFSCWYAAKIIRLHIYRTCTSGL